MHVIVDCVHVRGAYVLCVGQVSKKQEATLKAKSYAPPYVSNKTLNTDVNECMWGRWVPE